MESDRRKYTRLLKPLEAKWTGSSGGSMCRIADISWGGCFVQSPAVPGIGEATTIVAQISGREVTLTGVVIYLETGMGFGIEFGPLTAEQKSALAELLGAPPA